MDTRNENARNLRITFGWRKLFSRIPLSRLDYVLVLIVFVISLVGALYGEKITVNDGFGWDGLIYGNLAIKFSRKIFFSPASYDLTSYTIQRIAPSGFVHYAIRIIQQKFSTYNVILGFALLNVTLLSLSAVIWCLICNKMKVNNIGKLIGFLGMFGSFGLTKWVSFYPVLTDVSAFALGMGMLYCYLSNNKWLLLFLTILGAFTWPTLMYEGILFLLFHKITSDTETRGSPAPYRLHIFISLAASIVLTFIFQYIFFHYTLPVAVYPDKTWLPVSIFVAIICWFFPVSLLLNDSRLFTPKHWYKYFQPFTWLIVLFVITLIKIFQRAASVPDPEISNYMMNLLITAIDVPGKFIIAHIFFFGPITFLMIFWWKPVFQFIQAQGFGLILNTLLGLAFFLSSESRNLINYLPIFILGAAQVAGSIRLRSTTLWLFTILTIIFSRVWLPLNNTPAISHFIESLPLNLLGNNIAPEYPLNTFYWSSVGPWTTHQMYLIETVIAVIIGCILYFTMGRYRINPRTASSPGDQ